MSITNSGAADERKRYHSIKEVQNADDLEYGDILIDEDDTPWLVGSDAKGRRVLIYVGEGGYPEIGNWAYFPVVKAPKGYTVTITQD
jgi:hypothetical protein